MHRIFNFSGQFVALTIILSSLFSTFAQTTRQTRSKPATKTAVSTSQTVRQTQKCNGGWSGVVTFTKTLNESSDTTVKNNAGGTTRNAVARDYKYAGRITVDGSNPAQTTTRAQFSLRDEDKNFKHFIQRDTCFYDGKGVREQWSKITDNRLVNAFGEGSVDFQLNVNEFNGTYYLSFRFPEMQGTFNQETGVISDGWCQPNNNRNENKNSNSPTKVDREGAQIEDQKIDPKNPDVISGSKSWDTSSADIKSFKYTVTWSFRRCPAPLELEAVEFDEHPYPRWDEWRKVDGETVDGNIVRVRARVTNYSNETKFPKLRFLEQRANAELPESETNISIAPGESREVEYLWDTSGWAWEIGGIAASERAVKVELTEETSPTKNLSADILIIPRPVVLAHGLWADYTSWDGYDKFFKAAHSTSWNSYAVGATPENGAMNTGVKGTWKPSNSIEQNAAELKKQIEAVRRDKNAWHVDAVAHSMGGIIARHYIHFLMDKTPKGKPALTRLIQLGTPNMGSPCANLMGFTFWAVGKPVTALDQLRPVFMERFNRAVRDRKGTKFSVLVGNPLPQTCQNTMWGDGVVELPSAIWEINDFRYARSLHTDLTSRENFEYFVWRRLAVSWRGDHKPDTNYKAFYENPVDSNPSGARFINAGFNQNAVTDEAPPLPENLKVDLAKEITLAAKQTQEIEIPTGVNSASGITFMASPQISAVLVDAKGAIIGKNPAAAPEAKADFRTISLGGGAAIGALKLRFENTGAQESSVVLAVWTNSSAPRAAFTLEAGKANANGQIPLIAKISENGAPIAGTAVRARLASDDKTSEIVLLDDGKSGDGAANDGVYGALTEKLPDGDYSVTARAETGSQILVAGAALRVGADIKPAVKTKK